jgi:hypothetical protein
MPTSSKRVAAITAITLIAVAAAGIVGTYAYNTGKILLTNSYYHGRAELPAPQPGAENMTELLPKGPQNMELTFKWEGEENAPLITINGYIDLGEGKYGEDCAYHVTGITREYGKTWNGSVEEIRAAGSMAYGRNLKENGEPQDGEYGQWIGSTYGVPPQTTTLFLPMAGFSGPVVKGGGQGYCSIALLDDVATLGENGELVFDKDAVAAMHKLGSSAYVEELLDAQDASYWQRATEGSVLLDIGSVSVISFFDLMTLNIAKNGEETVITQRDDEGKPMIVAKFTPTDPQEVVAPDVPTEFDNIRAGK